MIITIVTCFSTKRNMNIYTTYDPLILSLFLFTKLDQLEYFVPSKEFFEL